MTVATALSGSAELNGLGDTPPPTEAPQAPDNHKHVARLMMFILVTGSRNHFDGDLEAGSSLDITGGYFTSHLTMFL